MIRLDMTTVARGDKRRMIWWDAAAFKISLWRRKSCIGLCKSAVRYNIQNQRLNLFYAPSEHSSYMNTQLLLPIQTWGAFRLSLFFWFEHHFRFDIMQKPPRHHHPPFLSPRPLNGPLFTLCAVGRVPLVRAMQFWNGANIRLLLG